jgi:UDP-glucose 4-epimerase
MRVLVTGGAGYIGSHAVRELINKGHSVVVIDNLSKGHQDAVDPRAIFISGDTANYDFLKQRLYNHQIEAVMHFAADIEVGESVTDPYKYYRNNFSNSLELLRAMRDAGVKKFVFSSTAAVYGNPIRTPIEEDQDRSPINPYGRSKMMTELAVEDFCSAHRLGYAILRYFNVAGASPDASIGEDHRPESHLIPRILHAARDGGEVKIFGTDYPTADGTCVRDYVHVVDLARAHVLALEWVVEGRGDIFNLGSEKGFSVREVISSCEKVVGKRLRVVEEERRAGDPAVLVASSKKIREVLKWEPIYPSIETIVAHAWHWHSTHPGGYSGSYEVPSSREEMVSQ